MTGHLPISYKEKIAILVKTLTKKSTRVVVVGVDVIIIAVIVVLYLGDGEHDHVVVVAVGDQLVPTTLLDHGRSLNIHKTIKAIPTCN